MPHTDTTPVSASIASTGKGIRYIGNWAYAITGGIDLVQDELTTMLDFTTDVGVLVGKLQSGRNVKTSAEHEHFVYFNDLLIWYSKMDNGKNPNQAPSSTPLILIIPPFTHVEWKVTSTDAETSTFTGIFTAEAIGMTDTGFQ